MRISDWSSDVCSSDLFTLTYEPNPNSTIYGRIARGFKSGGFNAGPSSDPDRIEFLPEYLTSYEVGYKTRFLGGRGHFESSVFYLDYTDIQQSDQDGAGFYISNAASVRNYELETQGSDRKSTRLNSSH